MNYSQDSSACHTLLFKSPTDHVNLLEEKANWIFFDSSTVVIQAGYDKV